MKPYIEFNTEKRMQATNEADKDFFKLSINSVYGKTMENMRKRMKIRKVTNEKDFIKYSLRPTFKNFIIFGKNIVAIHEKPEEIGFNKPIYVGCTVLEESKLEMYKFWYDFLKKVCEGIKLIYMDTDSFIFEVAENFNEIMLEHKEYFDLSNFPKDSKYYDSTNKKVPGKMKDEKSSQNINDVTALKSKSYIVITTDNKEEYKHKGHDANFTSDEFRDATINKKVFYHLMRKIISIRHKLYTKKCMKKSLSNFCEKRHLQSDEINTYALGHTNTLKKWPTKNNHYKYIIYNRWKKYLQQKRLAILGWEDLCQNYQDNLYYLLLLA